MSWPTGKFNFAGVLIDKTAGNGEPQTGTAFATANHGVEQRIL